MKKAKHLILLTAFGLMSAQGSLAERQVHELNQWSSETTEELEIFTGISDPMSGTGAAHHPESPE
jgi:hypothetical protein